MDLAGVLAPIPTPFDTHGRLDLATVPAMFAHWTNTALRGFVVLGSSGEAPLVDDDEGDRLIGAAREFVPERQLLIAGAGRESTRATVNAVRRAASLGADAVLVRTPGFFKAQMTADAFIRHYQVVADASPVPVLLYNFTAVTGVNLSPAAVSTLSVHPNIVGVKESGGDVAQIGALVAGVPKEFAILAGSAGTFHDALLVGAVGGILALACVLPDACCRLLQLARTARNDEALALQRRLLTISRLIGSAFGVPGLKAALKIAGCDVGGPRLPLLPLPPAGIEVLRQALADFNFNRVTDESLA